MGLSFGEIVVLAIVALIVIGPKDLPKILRTAGRMIGGVKRAVSDIRRETGLDEVLRGDFEDLVRLADHIERMEEPKRAEPQQLELPNVDDSAVRREREYPTLGADAYGMLPEDSAVYGDLPAWAGDDEGVVKPPGAPPEGAVAAAVGPASPHDEEAHA